MTTLTDQFKKDAEFLRHMADRRGSSIEDLRKSSIEDPRRTNIIGEQLKIIEELRRIANNVDMMATAMFEPSLQLQKKAEEKLEQEVGRTLLDKHSETDDYTPVALWLIIQQMKSNANKALIGGGLAGAAGGLAASLFGSIGKTQAPATPVAPIDPDDNGGE